MVKTHANTNFRYTFSSVETINEKISLEISPWLSKALGKKRKVKLTEPIGKDEKLKSLLERIARKYDGFGAMIYDVQRETLHKEVVVFVNNRPIAKDLELTIKGGDTIVVTPFYSGG